MSSLHEAFKYLGPVDFADVPTSTPELGQYMRTHFSQAQLLIDSVPPPPDSSNNNNTNTSSSSSTQPNKPNGARSRSASSASEILPSAARSAPLIPSHATLQKEWGKPLKLSAKDNPLGMSVYKLSAKDGRGAWFARRSTHEGLSFDRWKAALIREFNESLEVQGAPGAGTVRGIGGERRVERTVVEGVGAMEVLQLSAQFPGPTAPREFVTLLLVSAQGLKGEDQEEGEGGEEERRGVPRHFVVVSKPCTHPQTEPPKDGFIRGSYESVEIIREVLPPGKVPMKSASEFDLLKLKDKDGKEEALSKTAILKRAHDRSQTDDGLSRRGSKLNLDSPEAVEAIKQEARSRGKTISFAESRGEVAKGESVDLHDTEDGHFPVEWIMLTRSDPGGSVPRFMVERGTPSSICGDAVKFLDWACQKDLNSEGEPIHPPSHRDSFLAGLEDAREEQAGEGTADRQTTESPPPEYQENVEEQKPQPHPGVLSSLASAAYAGFESYAPKMVTDRLPGHSPSASQDLHEASIKSGVPPSPSLSSTASFLSFASAEDHISLDSASLRSSKDSTKGSTTSDPQAKSLQKLAARKAKLDAKLAKVRERDARDRQADDEKEKERIRKAEEKHAREVQKAEEQHRREVQKVQERHAKELRALEERRGKEERKAEERREKEERKKRERDGKGERDELRARVDALEAERDFLKESLGQAQAENTKLIALVGRLEGGPAVVRELKEAAASNGKKGGLRSRSGSELSVTIGKGKVKARSENDLIVASPGGETG